jgi:hypothetical protein
LGRPKTGDPSHHGSIFWDFAGIAARFCLTRLWRRPIIGLFWQPSRSLPAICYSPDGRGTDDHSRRVHHRADAGPLARKVAMCAYGWMIS